MSNRPDMDQMPMGPRMVMLLFVAAFVLVGMLLTLNMGVIGWGFLLAIMGGCVLLGYPRAILMVYFVWALLYPYVSTLYPSTLTKWSDELLVALMAGVLVMHYTQDRSIFRDPPVIHRIGWALLALTIISGLLNSVSKSLILHFTLQYLRMFLLFAFAHVFTRGVRLRYFFVAFCAMMLLQFVLNFGWVLGINPLPNWMSGPDIAIGTGIGANICAYYSVAMLFLVFSYGLHARGGFRRGLTFLLLLLTLMHLFIAQTYHAYLLLIASGSVYFAMHYRTYRAQLVLPLAAAVMLLLVVVALLPPAYFHMLRFELGPERIAERVDRLVQGPKGQSYVNTAINLPRDLPYPVFGAGPGNAGSMVARINFSPLAMKYFLWVDMSVDRQQLSSGGSIVGGPATGILTLWSELGIGGLLLYWAAHVIALLRVRRGLREKRYTDRYKHILAEAFVPTMLFFIMLSFFADYSWMAYMNLIWVWAGVLWRYDEPVRAAEPAKKPVAEPRARPRRYLPA